MKNRSHLFLFLIIVYLTLKKFKHKFKHQFNKYSIKNNGV